MKKYRVIKALMSTVVLITIITSSAMAYTNMDFSFYLKNEDGKKIGYSSPNLKEDNERQAYVTTVSGNLIAQDLFYVCVTNGASGTIQATQECRTDGYYRQTLPYYSNYGYANSYYRLRGRTDRYVVRVDGRWCP